MAAEEKLSDEQRCFVVMALACYDTPSAVAAAVKEEFGVVISRQAVQAYDPTKVAGKDVAKPWRDLFKTTRPTIPIIRGGRGDAVALQRG
jgi:hypothetical protein